VPRRKSDDEARELVSSKGFEPLENYPGSHVPWKLKCLTCEQITHPTLTNLSKKVSGCKYCAGRAVSPDSAVDFMLSKGVKPLEPYKGNKIPWKCKCLTCGRVITPKYNNVQNQHPCKFCSIKSTASRKVSKSSSKASAFMLSQNLKPLEEYPGSHQNWRCLCLKCNQIVYPKYNTVHQGDGGCKFCAPNYLDPREATRTMLRLGYQPLTEFESTKSKWRCVHLLCGREIFVRYNTISGNQGGCRYCAKHGFNFNQPAYFYLMTNSQLNAHKVGIGTTHNTRKDRIASHQKHGWELVNRIDFEVGEDAYRLEQSILEWIRIDLQLPHYLTKDQMPQRGETETVGSDSLSLEAIWVKVQQLGESKIKK
jgi:hypothetical protein